jgi:hypothetical protein
VFNRQLQDNPRAVSPVMVGSGTDRLATPGEQNIRYTITVSTFCIALKHAIPTSDPSRVHMYQIFDDR